MKPELLHEELELLQSCVGMLQASKPPVLEDGEIELHWPSGNLLAKGTITNGEMNGFWELFTEEGDLLVSASLVNGKLEFYLDSNPKNKA